MFSAYFTIELVVKVVAQGFVLGPKTYLADLANWLDVFIVGAGLFDFVPTDSEGGGGASSLRALRVLRPLRAVNKFPKLKALVVLIGLCVAKLTTAVGMNCFIFLVFGILGVQLYKGVLSVCGLSLSVCVCACACCVVVCVVWCVSVCVTHTHTHTLQGCLQRISLL
jgi:hypothetical protein